MKKNNPKNGAFVVVYRCLGPDHKLEILLQFRRDKQTWDLPGGQVEFNLDSPCASGPFAGCVAREAGEEIGLEFDPATFREIALFQQRVPTGEDEFDIGAVLLYQIYHPHNHSFSSAECEKVQWWPFSVALLKDKEIQLAARRMIAIFYLLHVERLQGASFRLQTANLGDAVIIRDGSNTHSI